MPPNPGLPPAARCRHLADRGHAHSKLGEESKALERRCRAGTARLVVDAGPVVGGAMSRRLRTLGAVELFNAVLLPAVFLRFVGSSAGGVMAWIAVDAVLVVGAGYWFARAAGLRRGLARTPRLGAFAVARVVLGVVLCAALVVVVMDLATGSGAVRWFAVAVWLFALAEYVNYFHAQLSYQNPADVRRLLRRRRLVPAHLGQELAGRARQSGSRQRRTR